MTLFICKICFKEFETKQSLGGHKASVHQKSTEYFCKYCNRKTTNSGANKAHENRCKLNPNKVEYTQQNRPGRTKGFKGTNQYIKAKELNLSKPIMSESTKQKLKTANKGRKHTKESKEKIS